MEFIIVWVLGSLFIASVFGTARTIGFWGCFLISMVTSPVIGLIITLFFETNTKAADRKNMMAMMARQQQPQKSVSDEMTKLKALFDNGTLNAEEYEAAKKKLLN